MVDETALIRALKNKQIAGAGLHVTVAEPLPKTSPLWDLPNVVLTPHVGGAMTDYMDQATAFFCLNLALYLAGGRLRNIVNRRHGY